MSEPRKLSDLVAAIIALPWHITPIPRDEDGPCVEAHTEEMYGWEWLGVDRELPLKIWYLDAMGEETDDE
jgi:hypothetical protein